MLTYHTESELFGMIRRGSQVDKAYQELFSRGWNLRMIHAFFH